MTISPHLKRLYGMLGPYKKRLGIAFLGMIMTALTEPMFPAVMRVLLDKGLAASRLFRCGWYRLLLSAYLYCVVSLLSRRLI